MEALESQRFKIEAPKNFDSVRSNENNKAFEPVKEKQDPVQKEEVISRDSIMDKEDDSKVFEAKTPIKINKNRNLDSNKSKMIDYEIEKLNTRIRASESMKKKLDIEYKPFSIEKRAVSYTHLTLPTTPYV